MILLLVISLPFSDGLSMSKYGVYFLGRRGIVIFTPLAIVLPGSIKESVASTIETQRPPRDVDVGGGFDLLSYKEPADKDVLYPKSVYGRWICEKVVAKVEGDAFQAESAHRSLGWKQQNLQPGMKERFETRYIESPFFGNSGVVLDRGYELASRTGAADVRWDVDRPNYLQHGNTKLSVVKRSVEVPNDQGFGFDELFSVVDPMVTRAVQIKRRYRRAYDAQGNRVIEGLEIMKTFRVLDGIAGTEMPTSTVKSQIKLVRP
jgi:hypothetical protein